MINKIFNSLCLHLNIKNKQELAKALGIPETTIYSWSKRGKIVDVDKVLAVLPEIRREFLKTGEGPMLKEQTGEQGGGYTVNQTITRRSGAPATTTPDASPSIEGRLVYHLSPLEASLIDAIRKRDKNDELAAELLVRILQK